MTTVARWQSLIALMLVLAGAGACGGRGAPPDAGTADADHAGHEEHRGVHLEEADLGELDILLEVAAAGELVMEVELPGEVRVNGDRMAHVAPRVGGVVREVRVSLGDRVRQGQLLAVLESRELAAATTEFLAARERLGLAASTAEREERLWRQSATSQQDLLDARTALAEARIAVRAAEQTLHALGRTDAELAAVAAQPDSRITMARLVAPFAGTVVDKHITLGETVQAEVPVLTIADLSSVWVDLSVYQKDLPALRAGQTVAITTDHVQRATGEIAFVQPIVGESTRTALARVVMDNPQGGWHPGCFVTARVGTSRVAVDVLVPRTALVRDAAGDAVVFVRAADGALVPREIEIGRSDADAVEIVSGLDPGETYVAAGAFALQAELAKDAFGDGHGH